MSSVFIRTAFVSLELWSNWQSPELLPVLTLLPVAMPHPGWVTAGNHPHTSLTVTFEFHQKPTVKMIISQLCPVGNGFRELTVC